MTRDLQKASAHITTQAFAHTIPRHHLLQQISTLLFERENHHHHDVRLLRVIQLHELGNPTAGHRVGQLPVPDIMAVQQLRLPILAPGLLAGLVPRAAGARARLLVPFRRRPVCLRRGGGGRRPQQHVRSQQQRVRLPFRDGAGHARAAAAADGHAAGGDQDARAGEGAAAPGVQEVARPHLLHQEEQVQEERHGSHHRGW